MGIKKLLLKASYKTSNSSLTKHLYTASDNDVNVKSLIFIGGIK